MADARLATGTWVSALLRRAFACGETGAVLRRGDPTAGAVVLVARARDGSTAAYARVSGPAGGGWTRAAESEEVERYLAAQARYDDDLWIVELVTEDIARLVDETMTVR